VPTTEPFESVLLGARSGAEWAWERLVHELDPVLRGYVRRQGGVDVDDLVGETWLHVARNLGRFAGDERAFRSWVFMIAHHRVVDERRRSARRPQGEITDDELAQSTPGAPSAELEALGRIDDEHVQALLDRLSREQREVVLLRFVADFRVTEIARIVGKNPGAVRALLRRALRRLEKILEREGTLSP
jgi:RNA polymerase sigma-70 factor (ECF subfamily)